MPSPVSIIPAVALVLLNAACGDQPAHDVSTVDSAGVAIVTSTAIDTPLPWTLTEVFRIGGADSGIGSFTSVSPFVVQTDGSNRIVVLNRDRNAVELFDSTGAPVASLGAKGSGPGEFSFAMQLLDLGDDTVGLFDFTKMAVVRWGAAGEVLPEMRTDPEVRVMRGDTAWIGISIADSVRSVSGVGLSVGLDTTALDTLVGPPRAMTTLSCFSAMLPPMFTAHMAWDFSDGVVAVTRQASYDVQLFEGTQLTTRIRRALAPTPTTAEMAERQYPEGWTVSFGNGGGCTMEPSEVAEKVGMASHLPVINNVAFGPRGTLWVGRHVFPGEPAVTDVFDASGAYLGTVHGKGLPLGWLGDDRVLFAIGDEETGVSVIGVFRISDAAKQATTS